MSSLSVGPWSTSFTAVLPGAWSLQGLVADALGALSTAPVSSTSVPVSLCLRHLSGHWSRLCLEGALNQ